MTTTRTAPSELTELTGAPAAADVAALIAEAPEPHPTLVKTFNAMMAREFRVLRRNSVATFTRAVMQPLLFVFVFAYVFPKIGGGFNLGGGAAAARAGAAAGGVNFATILVPGLMASMLLMQGIMAVTFPLVMEFSWQRTIEDRALAPVPIRVLAIQKIVAGAVQSFIGAVIVFPIVLFVHAAGPGSARARDQLGAVRRSSWSRRHCSPPRSGCCSARSWIRARCRCCSR